MWFSRKQGTGPSPEDVAKKAGAAGAAPVPGQVTTNTLATTTKVRGDAAEALARAKLVKAGLVFVEANFRTPGRGGGEIDLVMRARDGTLVYVEVRQRADASHGGAGASISATKQGRIVLAARHYLMRFATPPPCRFDVVLVHGTLLPGAKVDVQWLQAAFDAS